MLFVVLSWLFYTFSVTYYPVDRLLVYTGVPVYDIIIIRLCFSLHFHPREHTAWFTTALSAIVLSGGYDPTRLDDEKGFWAYRDRVRVVQLQYIIVLHYVLRATMESELLSLYCIALCVFIRFFSANKII